MKDAGRLTIAVDAMGGDYAPAEVVKGAVAAAQHLDVSVILVGDESAVQRELAKHSPAGLAVTVKHASQTVEMHEHPASAMRRKPDSSIVVSAELLTSGHADAMVSAGNTGAAMAVATIKLGRIRGIDRPAIGTLLPTLNGRAVMLDSGANVDCGVENLLQFAVMGVEYARGVLKIENPRVGLLSVGEEPTKGNALTQAANARLAESPLNFVGNVEGSHIFKGVADVIVCDGFAGNTVLKVAEGMAEFIFVRFKSLMGGTLAQRIAAQVLRPVLKQVKSGLDYAEYGGAPLLGVNGVCIICHGRSDARAIRNAIRTAADAAGNRVVEAIATSLQQSEAVLS